MHSFRVYDARYVYLLVWLYRLHFPVNIVVLSGLLCNIQST